MLLERGAELAALREGLRAAAEGRSAHLAVAGPFGIGRSALLHELRRGTDESAVRVLRANAAPTERELAFGVVRQLFDSLLTTAAGPDGEGLLARAGAARQVLGDDAATEPDPADVKVLCDLRSLLVRLSATAPVLILVDDLQWADSWSLRWFARLAAHPEGLRLLFVCSVRDGDPYADDPLVREVVNAARTLRLEPLSSAATGELVREHLAAPADEGFVRACHDTSLGRPLFLLSVLSELAGAGCRPLATSAGLVHAARPAHLRDRVLSCLLLQPQPVRDVAAAIATLPGSEEPGLLCPLTGLDRVGFATALRALHRLGLLAGTDPARFAHPAVREAVECSMSAADWQRWHEAAAEVLYDCGRPAEQVAAQLMAIPTHRGPRTVPVLRSAADSAQRRGEPDLAVRYLRRALLHVVEQDRTRAQLLVELARAELPLDPSAAESHIAQALPLLPTARDRAAAVLRLVPHVTSPVTPSAGALLRRAADDLVNPYTRNDPGPDEAMRLEARLRYAGLGDYAQLADAVYRLRVLEPSVRSRGGRELLAVLLYAATLGAEGGASEVARQARGLLDWEPATAGDSGCTMQLVLYALVGADSVQGVESWLNAAPRPGWGSDDGAFDAVVHAQHALFHLARGRLPQVRAHAERLVELVGDVGEESRCFTQGVLGALALSGRDVELCSNITAEAAGRLRMPVPVALLSLLRMPEQLRAGDTAAALETALECGRQLERVGWRNPVLFPWRPWAISLSHQVGDQHLARTLAGEEYARAEEWGAPVAIGRALRLRARTDGPDERVDLLRQAVGTLRDSANELELFLALRDLGRVLGNRAGARDALREAGELAVSCGVPWLAGSTAAAGRPSAPAARTALTRTESRVASLAMNGLTNQEIAAELRVTARAVEKHLTNSYRKFGVRGRRELAAVLNVSGAYVQD